jgi:hypothetical protein
MHYRNIAYLRTTNLIKILNWFKPEDIMALQAERRIFSANESEKPQPYLSTWESRIKGLYISYNKIDHGEIDPKGICDYLNQWVDGIAVVTELVQHIPNPSEILKQSLDVHLQDSYYKTGRKYGVIAIWKPKMYGKNAPERKVTDFIEKIKVLNAEELARKGFKLSTLDCIELKSYWQWKNKETGLNPADHEISNKLSEEIRKTILTDNEWKSNRGYLAKKERGWEMISW